MNEEILIRLKVVVERVVRPLRATVARKRLMREEMLTHLVAICMTELEKHRDEQLALERALQRFGDPRTLSIETQRSVPWWDRAVAVLEVSRLEPGETLPHFVGKQILFSTAAWSMVLLLPFLILLPQGKFLYFGVAVRMLLIMGALVTPASVAIVFLADRIPRSLCGVPSERSRTAAAFYCLASVLLFPVIAVAFYWSFYWGLGVVWPSSAVQVQVPLLSIMTLILPVALVVGAPQAADHIRYEEEWARLEIDQ